MPDHNYHLPYSTKTCIWMWKLETTAKGNVVYVSLLKQQGNSNFEFISVSFSAVTVGYIRYQPTVSLNCMIEDRIVFFYSFGNSFHIKTFQ